MTAHRPKPTLTPEIVERFAAYLRAHAGHWGAFDVILGDGNYHLRAADCLMRTDEERALARILDGYTESQRSRLAKKAKAFGRLMTAVAEERTLRVTHVDPTQGAIELEPIE